MVTTENKTFKVGDKVVGISLDGYNPYRVTKDGWEGEVTAADYNSEIQVYGEDLHGRHGSYLVDPRFFKIVSNDDDTFSNLNEDQQEELVWAEHTGETIQFRFTEDEIWRDLGEKSSWNADTFYRVKPAPTSDQLRLKELEDLIANYSNFNSQYHASLRELAEKAFHAYTVVDKDRLPSNSYGAFSWFC